MSTDVRNEDGPQVASCVSDAPMSHFSTNDLTEYQQSNFDMTSTSNYGEMDSDTTFDLPETCGWPYNEVQNMRQETSEDCDGMSDEAILNSNDSWLYFAIQQLSPFDQTVTDGNYLGNGGEEEEFFNPYSFPTSSSDLLDSIPDFQLQKEPQKRLPITLVLDLDETLVHSTLDTCEGADFSFPVHFSTQEQTVYVRQRPYLRMFLEAVAEGGYVKDLTILGRDLARIAIVDNSPQVFQLQVENGIPIESWFGDPSDDALLSLFFFLQTLVGVDDVRPIIKRKYGSQE
ncbi:CTD small phosphatase-like protein 2 isoform X2 [Papaver somniferum]|uniref:CTD small phosphatase-like protein 2 isoform X2 n=1 Tax=Papaver somniferum TaxID=3469 RepID=UPI000E6FEE11|nr:CTD small phosphatase-like protein 2 isoform X2 [Papaver somniferum]